MRLVLSFCGGAYPKFGIDWKEVHERGDTQIRMIKKSTLLNGIIEFGMFILVSMLSGFVTGGLSGSPWSMFEYWSRLTKLLCVHCRVCSI